MTPQDVAGDHDAEDDKSLVSYDDFNVEGISQEELQHWSKLAPKGQKLEDVISSPTKMLHDSDCFTRMLLAPIVDEARLSC